MPSESDKKAEVRRKHLTNAEQKTVAGLQADGGLMAPNAYCIALWDAIADLRAKLEAAERERLAAIERLMRRDAECDDLLARAAESERLLRQMLDAIEAARKHLENKP
jgi:molecular chaperone GrpE (heat shock protein)